MRAVIGRRVKDFSVHLTSRFFIALPQPHCTLQGVSSYVFISDRQRREEEEKRVQVKPKWLRREVDKKSHTHAHTHIFWERELITREDEASKRPG